MLPKCWTEKSKAYYLVFQNTRKSRLQIPSKCKFHSKLGRRLLLMHSSLAFRMAFLLRYNIWGSSSWAWVKKHVHFDEVRKKLWQRWIILGCLWWGCPESLAGIAVRSGVVSCTGFCMDGTGKLAVTRVGREVQVHSSPYWEYFLICQLNSNISFWQFYSTVKVTVSHLSSTLKLKLFVIILCSVFIGCLISPETLIRLSTFTFKVQLEHR